MGTCTHLSLMSERHPSSADPDQTTTLPTLLCVQSDGLRPVASIPIADHDITISRCTVLEVFCNILLIGCRNVLGHEAVRLAVERTHFKQPVLYLPFYYLSYIDA